MRILIVLIFTALGLSVSAQEDENPMVGKWDLTFINDGKELPSWLEIKKSGIKTYVGRFVHYSGSARPISEVKMSGDRFYFSIPKQWEEGDGMLNFEGYITDNRDTLKGSLSYSDGDVYYFTGLRAPKFKYTANPKWGKEIKLFNGKNTEGWLPIGMASQWKVEEGVLVNEKAGANLVTSQSFNDFKLHAEFRYPEGSNSGIYLRGRYEVQIADNAGSEPSDILFAGIYGFLTPSEMAAKEAGEWQTYDITLIGNRVTIVANGKTVIQDQAIPGITGGALDSNEGEPGPIVLQGDHGPVEFRAIIITPRVD
ncbi:3-keto-disaccharide hydrolase [Portibacter marinus]|uniref:3-keto-disaccharide hydrolase n=1 Tax=Portibacter marinus TaxID=2898660 RepID=UPI001F358487|nr:DUF1080 domain-containing protein [Portibacter marinus]